MISVYLLQFLFSFHICVEIILIKLGLIIFISIYLIFRLATIINDPFFIIINICLGSILCTTLIHLEWE